jgi:hypothetical protein
MQSVWGPFFPMYGNVPCRDLLPADVNKKLDDYLRLLEARIKVVGDQDAADSGAAMLKAELEDAEAIRDAALSGRDISSLGTPAQNELIKQRKELAARKDGLEMALNDLEVELEADFRRVGPKMVTRVESDLQKAASKYEKAIATLVELRAEYKRILFDLYDIEHVANGYRIPPTARIDTLEGVHGDLEEVLSADASRHIVPLPPFYDLATGELLSEEEVNAAVEAGEISRVGREWVFDRDRYLAGRVYDTASPPGMERLNPRALGA